MNRSGTLSLAWWMVPLAVALAFLGWETDWGRSLTPIPEPAEVVTPKPVPVSVLPDFTVAGGLGARPETVARTLFNPTRRPAPPVVAEAPRPTMKRGQFTLTGTLVIDGKSTAFLREVAGGKPRRVLQGESINGLTVAEVKPDRVRLTLGDESEDLVLKVQTNPKPTALAAAPVAPAAPAAPAQAPSAPPAGAGSARPTTAPVAAPQPAGNMADLLARRRAAREAAASAAAAAGPQGGAPTGESGAAPSAGPTTWEDVNRRARERAEQRLKQQK